MPAEYGPLSSTTFVQVIPFLTESSRTMKLRLETQVQQSAREVWQGFDQSLFLALAPPFPRLKLIRFDGSNEGDRVEIRVNFLLFAQTWESLITGQGEDDECIWFVDEGKQLPFFLKSWKHRHEMRKQENGCTIVDAIEYRSPSRLLDIVLFPAMWLQFAYRKPVYRRSFSKK